jgi:peptide/nickel transport system substrate-binding protein
MRSRTLALLAAVGVAAVATLTGCTASTPPGGTVTVAVTEPLTSLNPETAFGDTRTNSVVAHLTGSGFGYYDADDKLVRDESFGKAEIVSQDPFRVRYTIADAAKWSDGQRVDADDLLLAWAGVSGAVNTAGFDPAKYLDPATGAMSKDAPADAVYFDGPKGPGLQSSTGVPAIVPGGRAIEVTYSAPFPDWAVAVEPGLPAHVIGRTALGASADTAGTAVGDAIRAGKGAKLARVAKAWNEAGNIDAMPKDRSILAASGPYRIESISKSSSVTLVANPQYSGARQPHVKRIVLSVVADPSQAIDKLAAGDVDIVTPQASDAVMKRLLDTKGIRVTQGAQGVFEHLDLQFTGGKSGVFENPRVRSAFLHTVPRADILTAAIGPVDPDAQVLQSFTTLPGSGGYAANVRTNGSAAYGSVDLQAAVDELDAAGVDSPSVCILYDPVNPRRVAEFQLIQKSASRAGFSVTDCSTPDWMSVLGTPGAYDAALFSWDTTHLGPTSIASVYRSKSPLSNFSGYSNAKVDGWIADLDATDSAGTQRGLLAKIDAQLWKDAYGLPLYQYVAVAGISERVHGVSLSPQSDGVFWNAWDWRIGGSGS